MFFLKKKENLTGYIEKVINEYSDLLFRQAFYRLGKTSEAEEIVQDVFVAFYKVSEKGTEISNIKAYLLQSTHNACNNLISRRRMEIVPLTDDYILYEEVEPITKYEKTEIIYKLLKQLPEEQAEVIYLKLTEGLKFHEIAEVLQITESTVKSRFRYGVEKLKSIIQTKNYYNELF
ncbi:MAG: RNA polymerase sigma factor [Niabella sp.]